MKFFSLGHVASFSHYRIFSPILIDVGTYEVVDVYWLKVTGQ